MITNETSRSTRVVLYGRSDDTKPNDLPNASSFFEIDTSKKYWFDASTTNWYEDTSGGSGGGGGGDTAYYEDDVTFYDYNGNIYRSYSANAFSSMTEMPENPNNSGLTPQGWNWSLSGAKDYLSANGKIDIGQSYTTSDGSTRIYVNATDAISSFMVGLKLNGSATINWGDGSSSSLISGSNFEVVFSESHRYNEKKQYVIQISISGSAKFTGSSSNGSYIVSCATNNSSTKCKCVVSKVEIGSGIDIDQYGLSRMYSLKYVSVPSGCSIADNAFSNDYSLKYVVIPDNTESIGAGAFENDGALFKVVMPETLQQFIGNRAFYLSGIEGICLPEGLTSISSNAFNSCTKMKYIIIPSTVTSIGESALYNCCSVEYITMPLGLLSIGGAGMYRMFSLKEMKFESSSVPTAQSSTTFDGITEDCVIYVPNALYDSFVVSTNYPDPSTHAYIGY